MGDFGLVPSLFLLKDPMIPELIIDLFVVGLRTGGM